MATAEIRDGCEDARERKAARGKEYREAHRREILAQNKEWRESHKSERSAQNEEHRESLTDGYVATLLRLPTELIPPEMMELKRNRMKLTRELVILKKAIKGA